MNPVEQRLRDEVIYLHSLWHKGPPRNPNSNPKPRHDPSKKLHSPNPTPLKKNKQIKKKKTRSKHKSDPPKISDVEWPVPETPPATTSGWPALKPQSATPKPASADEKSKYIATQMQKKGLEASRGFFTRNCGSDGDVDEEDDFEEMDCSEECEEYAFFLNLFSEDSELRNYYEKNFESGDFICLVCGGIGKKVNKKFKNCVALVQHSIAISKTLKMRAHRAYGQVICKVLGWDMKRLPSIVLSLDNPLGSSLAKSSDLQGNDLTNNTMELSELMVCENASKEGNGVVHTEELDKEIQGLSANTKGLTDSSKGNGDGTEITEPEEKIVEEDGATNPSEESHDN